MNHNATHVYEPAGQPIYLSCSAEELIAVEMEAWTRGSNQAGIEAAPALKTMALIEEAAEQVCDQALEIYIPLDLARFRDVYTRAWCAGYCTRQDQKGRPAGQAAH